ncbi:hypothetical protein AAZX31_04G192400 [Glycine max]
MQYSSHWQRSLKEEEGDKTSWITSRLRISCSTSKY